MTAPYEAFRVADGWVMVAAGNNNLFGRLCRVLELEPLIDDPRFATVAARLEHRDVLHDLLEARTEQFTLESAERALVDAGVPVSPVNRLDQTLAHPLTAERDVLVRVSDDPDDDRRAVRLPIGSRTTAPRWAPELGEHTREVLEQIGLSPALIDDITNHAGATPAGG
jgi:CoA:oxalate CoA-transferase